MNVLIVEDESAIAQMYKTSLEMMGFNVASVSDGQSALDFLRDDTPDLILLDMNLPQVSGHYVYKTISAEPRFADIPVIISTANTPVANALSQEIRDIDRILIKPVGIRDLKKIIEEL